MALKLSDVIAELERLREDYEGEDPEVRIAYQPGHALQEPVFRIGCSLNAEVIDGTAVVWLAGGGGNQYLGVGPAEFLDLGRY